MAEREYKRTDKGRFASPEEIEKAKSAELDSEMSNWFVAQIKGRDDRKRKLFAAVLGKLPDSGQEVVRNDR